MRPPPPAHLPTDLDAGFWQIVFGIAASLLFAAMMGLWSSVRRLFRDVRTIRVALARTIVMGQSNHDILLVMVPSEHTEEVRAIVRKMNTDLKAVDGEDPGA